MTTRARRVLPLCTVLLVACSSSGSNGGKGNGGDGDDGTPTSSATGDFKSTWQAVSMTYQPLDRMDVKTLDIPPLVADTVSGRNFEMYVSFEGDQRILYARYEGATDTSYTIRETMQHAGEGEDEVYAPRSGSGSYMLRDGLLEENKITQLDDGTGLLCVIKYRKLEQFPPEGWPTQTQSYEVGGGQ